MHYASKDKRIGNSIIIKLEIEKVKILNMMNLRAVDITSRSPVEEVGAHKIVGVVELNVVAINIVNSWDWVNR